MSRYGTLFDITLYHQFIGDQPCSALYLELDTASQALLSRAGLLIRCSAARLQVLHDETRADVLSALIADAPLVLCWRMQSCDPSLAGCSEPSLRQGARVLYLESSEAHPQGLHAARYVGESDIVSFSDARLKAYFTPRDHLLPPLAFIVVHINDLEPRHYQIHLQTLQSYWRYRVLGELDENVVSVIDADGLVTFKSLGRELVGDGRTAATYISSATLPLRARGGPRFALHPDRSERSRAIVERLPLASVASTRHEIINGAESRVSDIYVNL